MGKKEMGEGKVSVYVRVMQHCYIIHNYMSVRAHHRLSEINKLWESYFSIHQTPPSIFHHLVSTFPRDDGKISPNGVAPTPAATVFLISPCGDLTTLDLSRFVYLHSCQVLPLLKTN